jgi:hypothetical protein
MERAAVEVYEIVSREFSPCGAVFPAGERCPSVRRFAVRGLHIGLYCGLGPQAHQIAWLPNLPWAKPSDFVEPGPFAGWIPGGAFAERPRERKRKRHGGWDLSENIRHEFDIRVRQRDAKCVKCEATWFRGERESPEALDWLRAHERSGLWVDVCDALRKMMPKPTALEPVWHHRLPVDIRFEVDCRFDDSRLRPDHALSIAFLRAAKLREGPRFTTEVQRFAVDGMALPLCGKCSRARGALLFATPNELLACWARYRFSGNVAAARSHPDFTHFDYLGRLAFQTDIAAGLSTASHQRERRA